MGDSMVIKGGWVITGLPRVDDGKDTKDEQW